MEKIQKKATAKSFTFETLPEIAKNGLRNVAKKKGIELVSADIESGCKRGDGFMSEILRVHVKGRNVGTSDDGEFHVLVKIPKAANKELSVFEREIGVYTKLFPLFEDLQKEYKVSHEDSFHNFPVCHVGELNKETGEAVIILDDVRDAGFELGDKYKTLNAKQSHLVVQSMGRFHALSFALKAKKPEVFDRLKEKFVDIQAVILLKDQMKTMWKTVFRIAHSSLMESDNAPRKKLEDLQKNLKESFESMVSTEYSSQNSAILHGDCKINNFLFKENDVSFIDWQMTRYASPALDFSQFLYTSLDKATREAEYDNLVALYHKSFCSMLEKFGITDIEKHFSKQTMIDHMEKMGRYGVIMALCVVPLLAVSAEQQKETIEDMLKAMEDNSEKVKTRIRDVIVDAKNRGFL